MRLAGAGDATAIRALADAAYGKCVALIGRKPMPMTTDYEALVAARCVWLLRDGPALSGVLVLVDEAASRRAGRVRALFHAQACCALARLSPVTSLL